MHSPFTYRVGIMGCPSYPYVSWNEANLTRLKELGFNTLQLNIAWASRPADEPLNLEDVVELPEELRDSLAGGTPLLSDRSPERFQQRRKDLRSRIALCREHGFRSIFHFGAPYVGDRFIGDAPANCLLDGKTEKRCLALLSRLAEEFPRIDDILIYTYDQHAWLCSEFGPCPRCTGIPLHERVAPFFEKMSLCWRKYNPGGRLWWEPWELSGGQVFRCIEVMNPEGFGLSLHSNIAEVMAAHPVDRWLKNSCVLAADRGIPVIVEHWLGGPNEEVQPCLHLSHPLVTLKALRSIASIPKVSGLKEYYGLLPDREDPNLRMTGLFLEQPDISDEEALRRLVEPYGCLAANEVIQFWRLCGEGIEFFPWDATWRLRCLGARSAGHELDAARVLGIPWHTPSWESTRRAIYMKTGPEQVDPWFLEDLQVRFRISAERMARALEIGVNIVDRIPEVLRDVFKMNLEELDHIHRAVLGYAYHFRETNLATVMRSFLAKGEVIPRKVIQEMRDILVDDKANQGGSSDLDEAIACLAKAPEKFARIYFLPVPGDAI